MIKYISLKYPYKLTNSKFHLLLVNVKFSNSILPLVPCPFVVKNRQLDDATSLKPIYNQNVVDIERELDNYHTNMQKCKQKS